MEQPAHAGFFNHREVLTSNTSDRGELVRLAGEQTINNYVSALRSAMDLAVLDKLLTENPVATLPCAKWQREPPDSFDREELERITDCARAKFAPTVGNLIAFRFFSGLGTSEMVTLRWRSIDGNKKQVLIHEVVVKGLRKQAKMNKARLVSLNSRALDALERQKEQTPEGATRQRGRGRHAPNHTQGLTDGLCGTDAWRSLG